MHKSLYRVLPVTLLLTWQSQALAFRNCEEQMNANAYRGSSRYSVSELEFDALSRHASGTVTHYNYSNSSATGLRECHVTYELSGVFEQGSALFLLEGNRSNQSHGCDGEFVASRYPAYRAYTLQIMPSGSQEAVVLRADNGDSVARAEWHDGYMTYKTPEVCELM